MSNFTDTPGAEEIGRALVGAAELSADHLYLDTGGCVIRLRSNAETLITRLRHYFAHVVSAEADVDIDVVAIESAAPELGLTFIDWKREPGKTGRKDSYFDLNGARVIRKVRTGMVFLQSETRRIAAGPCLENDNQVVNFINAQYMNWLQQRGWLICHAAALVIEGEGVAIAGFSGGGKSTLMLHMLAEPDSAYLTNDRLFIHRQNASVAAKGIPKLPRINPGTILNNPKLTQLLPPERRESLLAMPVDELWALDEKYDVMIDQVYGKDRIVTEAPLNTVLILNWQRETAEPVRIAQIDLSERRELLSAVMKSPGPFYQYADGTFFQDSTLLDEQAYLGMLEGVRVFEVSGVIDFHAVVQWVHDNQPE